MKCPYCRKNEAAEKPLWPFCSKRCKMLDLGAWAKEEYRVSGNEIRLDESNEEFKKNEDIEE